MHRRHTRVLAASAATLTALALASCASSDRDESGDTSAESGGGTFVFGAAGDPTMFDPAFATDGESFRVTRQIYEGLLTNEEGSADLAPALAESYEVSDDGLAYTFSLREGVTFHDGTEFDADAVCFNFDRQYNFTGLAASPAASEYWQNNFGGFASTPDVPSLYAGCEATDPSTAVITLTQTTSRFPAVLALPSFAIQSPAALEQYAADELGGNGDALTYTEYALEHPTGTGPFKFESWDQGNSEVRIVRNDDYWGDPSGVQEIVFRSIPDGNTRRQELQAGSIDGYDLVAPADYQELEDGGFQVLPREPFNILYLGINGGNVPGTSANPALKDIRVRQALAHAIDRDTVVSSLLPEGAEAAIEFVPPTVDGWTEDVTRYDYDPAKARDLLTQAGALNTTLRFYYPTDVSRPYLPDPAAMFEVISKNLTDAGFTIEPVSLPWNPDYLDAVQAGQADVHLLGWTGDYNDAYNFIGTFFADAGGGKAKAEFGGFSSPEVFTALAAGDAEPDVDARGPLYEQANKAIMDYLPAIPISHSPNALVVAEDVQGLVPSPLSAEDFSPVTVG
ncbi:ABC transporter substrate-binding protein [Modestobacter sp. I12A-02628]|uniref:ABC transporter substrate-binding protein n=1 Tax=Goekera deserti TaxID=2497753 RepID=A0A7K3WEY5_9ACTN|nr:ABC transporter substrate-binding protein [Goekera deserti]MPQ98012.1 ABC transporter substrate-binding protein [Goekera deserti]NDI48659.1 ABC transporter substrate-binding protein [Goekera deserti]NEL54962.1 ABC transporter substrate-binding protein [Goekera deserti]